MPTADAISATDVASYPCTENRASAVSRILSRVAALAICTDLLQQQI